MQPLFHERLTPGVLVLLVSAIFGAMLGVILIPISSTLALIVGIVLAVVVPGILVVTSPVVEVTEERVTAGRAWIAPGFLGDARVLSATEFRDVLGPGIRPEDFRVTRGWITEGVEIPVVDDEDPTPAWIVSLRRPSEFAAALSAAQRTAAATPPSAS